MTRHQARHLIAAGALTRLSITAHSQLSERKPWPISSVETKGSVLPAAGWSFVTGNFSGNAIADVAAYHPSDGSLW